MASKATDDVPPARPKAPRIVLLALALLPVAACSTPAAPQHSDPFYVAPAVPRDGGPPPTVNAGPRHGGGAHGGGYGGNAGDVQPAGPDAPGSGSMSLGTGGAP